MMVKMITLSSGPVPILVAPTASGKSALAAELAATHGLEILSADAFSVYKGLDIGTAKPGPAERLAAPHHLIDVVEVVENYNVLQWLEDAERLIAEMLRAGRCPLVVGGTGLYVHALAFGRPLTPPSDRAVRAALTAELEKRGLDALLAEIEAISPEEAARMERNPRRVLRALEVWRTTGKFPSQFGVQPPRFACKIVNLQPDPQAHVESVQKRTKAMLRAGWAEEAAWLREQVSPESGATVWQTLGYREALAVHDGLLSEADAASQIAAATLRYAKRQRLFFKNRLLAPPLSPEVARAQLLALVQGR